jgi:hypothetical protein
MTRKTLRVFTVGALTLYCEHENRSERASKSNSVICSYLGSCKQESTANARGIGADFHRAMVAAAPGEKLLIGRRPMKN